MLVMYQLSRSDLEKDFIKKLNAKLTTITLFTIYYSLKYMVIDWSFLAVGIFHVLF